MDQLTQGAAPAITPVTPQAPSPSTSSGQAPSTSSGQAPSTSSGQTSPHQKKNIKLWVGVFAAIVIVSIGVVLFLGRTTDYEGKFTALKISPTEIVKPVAEELTKVAEKPSIQLPSAEETARTPVVGMESQLTEETTAKTQATLRTTASLQKETGEEGHVFLFRPSVTGVIQPPSEQTETTPSEQPPAEPTSRDQMPSAPTPTERGERSANERERAAEDSARRDRGQAEIERQRREQEQQQRLERERERTARELAQRELTERNSREVAIAEEVLVFAKKCRNSGGDFGSDNTCKIAGKGIFKSLQDLEDGLNRYAACIADKNNEWVAEDRRCQPITPIEIIKEEKKDDSAELIKNLQNEIASLRTQLANTPNNQEVLNRIAALESQLRLVGAQAPAAPAPIVVNVTTPAATTQTQPGTACADPSFTYDPVRRVCVPPTEVIVRPAPASPQPGGGAVGDEEELVSTRTATTVAAAGGESGVGATDGAASSEPAASSASTTGTSGVSSAVSRVHGAFIQGETGPEVLLYPLLIGAANGLLFVWRRRKNRRT